GNVVRQHLYSERIAAATYSTVAEVATALALANDSMLSNDRESRTVYDARSRAVFGIDGAGAVTRNTFDGAGNIIESTSFATFRRAHRLPMSPPPSRTLLLTMRRRPVRTTERAGSRRLPMPKPTPSRTRTTASAIG